MIAMPSSSTAMMKVSRNCPNGINGLIPGAMPLTLVGAMLPSVVGANPLTLVGANPASLVGATFASRVGALDPTVQRLVTTAAYDVGSGCVDGCGWPDPDAMSCSD